MRLKWVPAAVVVIAAAASALDVGVGAFYAPARVVGEVTETEYEEYGGKGLSKGGFKGRVSLGVYEGLNVTFGFGYNNLSYRGEPITFPEISYVTSIPTYITTVGADYGFLFGRFSPFVGGGAALARESAEGSFHETVDWYGGLYAEGGVRYPFTNNLVLEAAPRYTFLFDEPAVYDDLNLPGFVRAEHRSQLVELLVGINYYF